MGLASVTFVTPHQRTTSGGVHVIEQFAQRLSSSMQVNLVVLDGPLRPLPGVDVTLAKRLSARRFPEADVLLFPGDSTRADELLRLPSSVGRPVLLVQSHGHPNGDATLRNLGRVPDAIAVSSWLAECAAQHGCRASIVRPGLDRRVFFPPRQGQARGRRVSMLLHRDAWKGHGDGLAALRRVRSRVRGCELHVFGTGHVDEPGIHHHGTLNRTAVGWMLRRSAVFACPSWEEGLGLPGLEALACGAALATTDTGGSRDYAVHGVTALVSPPRQPDALGDNILELLRDRAHRVRLAGRGCDLVRDSYPTWSTAARRLHAALARL